MNIHFEKANLAHQEIIFNWLKESHVQEFWDNTQAHKDDILNFMNGRKTPSDYCDGLYSYWVGSANDEPYCLLMTLQEKKEYDIGEIKKAHLSKTGHSYGLDYMIGNKDYLGKGLGAKTLDAFLHFFRTHIDTQADTFLIDPDADNPRAKHIYIKAGFEEVGDFIMRGDVSGAGQSHSLLVKRFE
jgi:RimJ/RimL family protein N-acetyltransferase